MELTLTYLRFIQQRDALSLLYSILLFVRPFDFDNSELSRSKASAEAADQPPAISGKPSGSPKSIHGSNTRSRGRTRSCGIQSISGRMTSTRW
ncbi:hypothetical protein CCGE525_37625 (plasmid) [Rhizobium jaguaris]|uniref:Uncharacterized protein n=1 Tax=Rhizobium jaguaris TaxID=1312183 RepID=A0A387FZH9_9HYPH|nr:hypothetical protein CCGE525_37625 [Rhizobium jaguaris]